MTNRPDAKPVINNANEPARRIRSYVRRDGRLTPSQQRNLDLLWPRYGLGAGSPLDWDQVFARTAPRVLDIGFGAGESLLELAATHADRDYVGIEVYRSGVGRVLGAAEAQALSNVRVFCADAVEVLTRAIPEASLDEVLLYFPDPWHKKRHHKRRLVQTTFADSVARVLKSGGIWRLATDWADYAEWMRTVLDPHPGFCNIGDRDGFVTVPQRPRTRFEQRGSNRGHTIFDLAYRRD